jgi:hypothetical protein
VATFLWGNAAVLLLVVLALSVVFLGDLDEPPMFFNPRGSLVDEGVAMVMVCGKQPTRETVNIDGGRGSPLQMDRRAVDVPP